MEEPEHLTWDTLAPYLEAVIAGTYEGIRDLIAIGQELPAEDSAGMDRLVEDIRCRKLHPLEWLVPLVREMKHRPAVHSLTPILSLQTVRLFRSGEEFAWLEATGEGQFRLRRAQYKGILHWDTEMVCEGEAMEIADAVERL